MAQFAYLLSNNYPWLSFVAAGSEEGARWAQEYSQPEISDLYSAIIRSLKLMGRMQVEEALVLLEDVHGRILNCDGRYSPSVIRVIECWYYGALAYYHYCREDFPLAEATLLRGHAAISAGVEAQRIILPMVYRCCDTWLHRSRIARSQNDWVKMRHCLDMFRAIHRGDEPFCQLSDGSGIYAAELEQYLQGAELDDEMREYSAHFCSRENRGALADYYAEAIYMLPTLPIHF